MLNPISLNELAKHMEKSTITRADKAAGGVIFTLEQQNGVAISLYIRDGGKAQSVDKISDDTFILRVAQCADNN